MKGYAAVNAAYYPEAGTFTSYLAGYFRDLPHALRTVNLPCIAGIDRSCKRNEAERGSLH